jgi:hypothetical protein
MKRKLLFLAIVGAVGFGTVGVIVCQIYFFAAVIPHGGIF